MKKKLVIIPFFLFSLTIHAAEILSSRTEKSPNVIAAGVINKGKDGPGDLSTFMKNATVKEKKPSERKQKEKINAK